MDTTTVAQDYPALADLAIRNLGTDESREALKALREIARLRDTVATQRQRIVGR